MTTGIVLIKGRPDKLDYTFEFLTEMKEEDPEIIDVYLSMGWPDIVVLIKTNQVLDIQGKVNSIRYVLRNREVEYRDFVDTSTIVCIEQKERKKIEEELSDYVARFGL